MKEKCDHAVGTFNFRLTESHALIYQSESPDYESLVYRFDFCPLCGSSLKETALDRVLWKAVNKPNPGGLFPSQSLEHAVEFLKLCKKEVGKSYISLDKVFREDVYPLQNESYEDGTFPLWEVSIRAMEFYSKSSSKALTKALLWATTELTKETVESLIKEEKGVK